MKLRFCCPPELAGRLPQPVPARTGLPAWLRDMPARAAAEAFGFEVRTVKQCPPFVDAMSCGILMPLLCDVRVAGGRFEWDWDLPASTLGGYSRAPLSFHVPEQATGAPFFAPGRAAIKFNNLWTVELPEGWSLLVCHPFNRADLPFRTLTGLVDADRYTDAFIQFPALWLDDGFEGILQRGSPVAQCVPVPRQGLDIELGEIADEAAARFRATAAALEAEPGVYRRRFRAPRRGATVGENGDVEDSEP